MALYRINPDADDRDVFHAVSTDPGEEPPMIPVEPNLRLCFTHNTFEWGTDKGEPCWQAETFTDPSPCQWFAAAEIPKEDSV